MKYDDAKDFVRRLNECGDCTSGECQGATDTTTQVELVREAYRRGFEAAREAAAKIANEMNDHSTKPYATHKSCYEMQSAIQSAIEALQPEGETKMKVYISTSYHESESDDELPCWCVRLTADIGNGYRATKIFKSDPVGNIGISDLHTAIEQLKADVEKLGGFA